MIANFKQTVWSAKIQHQLETITSLKDHCDFQFEIPMFHFDYAICRAVLFIA